MKVLVTGASGFAGSHLVEALVAEKKHEVFGTVYGTPGYIGDILDAQHIVAIDLTSQEKVQELFQSIKPDYVFHLAAFAAVGNSFEKALITIQNNTVLQMNLLEAVRQYCPDSRLLIVGSAEEYGISKPEEVPINENHPFRPANPYAVSKVSQDLLAYAFAQSYHLNIVRVRPFNHIGERQTPDFAIPAFAQQIVRIERGEQQKLQVGNLDAIRDFTDVKDVVSAYMLLMEKGQVGEVYNIGSGVGRKMLDMLNMLVSQAKVAVPIEQDQEKLRPIDVPIVIADVSKLKSLGWKIDHPIEETLSRVLEWWRENL